MSQVNYILNIQEKNCVTDKIIRVSLGMYRRSANAKTNVFTDHPKAGDVYYEFNETWERPRGDEQGKHKRRISQELTGRRFCFVDSVTTPELVEDTKKYKHKDILVLVHPEDFTYLRLRQI